MENLTGAELIAKERQEQIEKHGRTLAHDLEFNQNGQLAEAASFLCLPDWGCNDIDDIVEDHCPLGWDEKIWRKMLEKPYGERIIIAGALMSAEIDRIQGMPF